MRSQREKLRRKTGFPPWVVLVALPKEGDDLGGSEARRASILDQIRKNPGIHHNALKRTLGLSNGALDYHLDGLESDGLIRSEKRGRLRMYWVAGAMPAGGAASIREAILELAVDSG